MNLIKRDTMEEICILEEKNIEQIYSHADVGIIMGELSREANVDFINKCALEILGYTKEQFKDELNNNLMGIEKMGNSLNDALEKLMIKGENTKFKIKTKKRNGANIVLSCSCVLSKNGENPTIVIYTINDITKEEKIKEHLIKQNEELKINKKMFEAIVKYAQVISYAYLIETDEIIFSDDFIKIFAVPKKISNASTNPILKTIIRPDCYNTFNKLHAQTRRGQESSNDTIVAIDQVGNEICYDVTINCIFNTEGKPIKAVVLLKDSQKTKEIGRQKKMSEEQRLYEIMLSHSEIVYETNISKDVAVRGYEDWFEKYGIVRSDIYSVLIEEFSKTAVHEDDVNMFKKVLSRDNILIAYAEGEKNFYCEYRCPNENGVFNWFSCTMNLFEDWETGDIKGFSCVKDINDEKLKQLKLIYCAEHDQLTNCYNKAKTEQLINEYLKTDEGKHGKHAFFIFDLDHFKNINDTFGHSFGDVVLSSASEKVRQLFRDNDILGRIGGDEFVAFMKNIHDAGAAKIKAQEICEAVNDVFTNSNNVVSISTSVGIALYPKHATDFERLYLKSDVALYAAKENGRNRFDFYSENLKNEIKIDTPIDVDELIEVQSFERNISEYMFRILYDNSDKMRAIYSVLELVGRQFKADRAYIFEDSLDGETLTNTFEWCNVGVVPEKESLKNIPYSELGDYKLRLNETGVFYMPNFESATNDIKSIIKHQNIKSMIHFAILRNKKYCGFIGFDFCDEEVVPSKYDITQLKTVANMLGVFLGEMRALNDAQKMRNAALLIVDRMESYAYVVDIETHKLLFLNQNTKKLVPNANIGNKCYKVFWNSDKPCEMCPIKSLESAHGSKRCMDLKNDYLNMYMLLTATLIFWTDNQKACLMECANIESLTRCGQYMKDYTTENL